MLNRETVEEAYDGGFSFYAAAWPLQARYPGRAFQSGLFGTWMSPQADKQPPDGMKLYTKIEGGLGWWRSTEFATTTPKFHMGGVGLNFSDIANGPGAGKGTWQEPQGLYGVAQLSNRLLFPPDGLNLKQGAQGGRSQAFPEGRKDTAGDKDKLGLLGELGFHVCPRLEKKKRAAASCRR